MQHLGPGLSGPRFEIVEPPPGGFFVYGVTMGQRGPKPLPANVHVLRGNPSKKPLGSLFDELRPEVELPSYPSWLWKEAKKEWKRIGEELVRYGLISKLDRAALVQYVQAWAKYAWAEEKLSKAMRDAEAGQKQAEAEGKPWTGGDGIMVPTTNGNMQYSHYWVVSRNASTELDRHLQKFGLHAAARSRVTPSDNRQATLFGEQGPATADEFEEL